MNIYEKLSAIQNELKCPKSQYNSFGKFRFRSCEDILEAAKPICRKYNALLVLEDTVEAIGDRIYVKAIAVLWDIENPGESLSNQAYAREDFEKKGMDGSQLTGTSSSYARKYALNGLFNIDDTKDADTDAFHEMNEQAIADIGEQPIGQTKLDTIQALNIDPDKAKEVLKEFGYNKSSSIKVKDFAKVFEALKKLKETQYES